MAFILRTGKDDGSPVETNLGRLRLGASLKFALLIGQAQGSPLQPFVSYGRCQYQCRALIPAAT